MGKFRRKTETLTKIFQKISDRNKLRQMIKKRRKRVNRIIDPAQEHEQIREHPGGDLRLLPEDEDKNAHEQPQKERRAEHPQKKDGGHSRGRKFEAEEKNGGQRQDDEDGAAPDNTVHPGSEKVLADTDRRQ